MVKIEVFPNLLKNNLTDFFYFLYEDRSNPILTHSENRITVCPESKIMVKTSYLGKRSLPHSGWELVRSVLVTRFWQNDFFFQIFNFWEAWARITIFGHLGQNWCFKSYLSEISSFQSCWGLFRSVLVTQFWQNAFIFKFLIFGGSGSELPYLGIWAKNNVLSHISVKNHHLKVVEGLLEP